MTNNEIIEGFCESLSADSKDEKTIYSYKASVKKFDKAVGGKSFHDVDIFDIDKYLTLLKAEGYSENTLNSKYLQAMRLFLRYMMAYKVNTNFADNKELVNMKLKNKKFDKRKIEHHESLSAAEFKSFLAFCKKTKENTPIKLRRKVVTLLFLTTGMRREELVTLKKSDFDFENLKVTPNHQKFSKVRTVGVQKDVMEVVKKLFASHGQESLFITATNEELTNGGINRLINGVMRVAMRREVITKKVTPHGLRKSMATYLFYEKGIPITTIAEILGHESIITTQIYIDRKSEDAILTLSDENLFK